MTNKIQVHSLSIHPILHLDFTNFSQMQEYSIQWEFYDMFRFGTQPFGGQYDIYMDEDIQIAHAIYHDGLMYRGCTPRDTVTLVLFMEKDGSLTGNKTLLEAGDIFILDDSNDFEIAFSHRIEMGTVAIEKGFVDRYFPYLHEIIGHVYQDRDNILRSLIQNVQHRSVVDKSRMQKELIACMEQIALQSRTKVTKKLSKKEKCIFDVRDYIVTLLEENLKVEDIAQKFDMSDRTLQTAFKKIFGYTPKKFTKLLKYNMAYQEIIIHGKNKNISQIAMQYGFHNFGLFSQEFKKMFGQLPSEMLRGGEPYCLNAQTV